MRLVNLTRTTVFGALLMACLFAGIGSAIAASDTLVPLLKSDQPVDWWFMFKLNSDKFPGCDGGVERVCAFGGDVQPYQAYGQQFVYASSNDDTLKKGNGCAGDSVNDPLGATFDQIYNGSLYYVIWNDQFYDDPKIDGCTKECGSPWGHSKGVLAWNDAGDGLVLQVTTPSWPASGSKDHPRQHDGNTLGCVLDNDVLVSQHFFALKLTKSDVLMVLKALQNASVVTDSANGQIVHDGGPADIQALVEKLGSRSDSSQYIKETLSSGVVLISKPSRLHVPPWQMVSAVLGGVSLRTATWWASPQIYSTTASTPIACWDASLGKPGAIEIAKTGHWGDQEFGLIGGGGHDRNHAKIGVSTSGSEHYTIFGDMNQQGTAVAGRSCASSQNGRGGLFYVLHDDSLWQGVSSLIAGETEPTRKP
jgi:hypothetical protein